MGDQNHLFTCPDAKATEVFTKDLDDMKIILEDLETKPSLQVAILAALKLSCLGIIQHTHAFRLTDFSDGLTLPGIMRDQHRIGWINFFAGQWGFKVERSTEKALPEDEQEEGHKTLGGCQSQEDDHYSTGFVAVLKPSTSLTDWTSRCSQSSLLELPNKRGNCQRKRRYCSRVLSSLLWP